MVTEYKIGFKDINRLFAPPAVKGAQLEDVSFNVKGDDLVFTWKPGKSSQIPFGEDAVKPRYTLEIEAEGGGKVRLEIELSGDDSTEDKTLVFPLPGHSIVKKSMKFNFADYPVVILKVVVIASA